MLKSLNCRKIGPNLVKKHPRNPKPQFSSDYASGNSRLKLLVDWR